MYKILCLWFAFILFSAHAKEVHYQLTIDYLTVNYSGEPAQAMAINGSIPGPVLEFQEGDTAVIDVTNLIDGDASIHWHGLLLPQEQDGVPYITFLPIKSGQTFQYRFDLMHAGTYWYHSHTRIDEQKGQYGAIVVHPKAGYQDTFDHDIIVQLSDWTDEDPHQVLKNLKKDGDWYAYKKDSVISIKGYLQNSDLDAWISNRWQRMEGMDVSDVGYDAFLANGQTQLTLLPQAKAGEKVRVRLINSGASSFFDIQQSSGDFTVVAADGLDVQPIQVNEFRMGMAETYDVIVTIADSGAYEFAANNIDGTGGVKVTLGQGKAAPSPNPVRPNLFAKMDHAGHSMHMVEGDEMDDAHSHHHHMHHHQAEKDQKLNYNMLKSRQAVNYQGDLQEFTLELTGDMHSYNWSFNNIPLSAADKIKIDRGKVVRFHFVNQTMMNHPLHLHGHFFKVLSGNGEHDVLKHTVNVPPMGNMSIEFAANEEKDWLFHCHNLYHAKTGMSRIVRYSDYPGNPAFDMAKMRSSEIMDTDWYGRGDLHAFSTHAEFMYRYSNNKYEIEFAAERHFSENEQEFALDVNLRQSRWLHYFAGVEREHKENEFQLGLKYVLPFSIDTAVWVTDDGQLNAEAETEFQLTEHLGLELEFNTESEWEIGLEYRHSPKWSLSLNANEISAFGIGLTVTF